jgi:hypothetical protein
MLDLQSRIHFQKVKVLFGIDHEFDGTCASQIVRSGRAKLRLASKPQHTGRRVLNSLSQTHSLFAHFSTGLRIEKSTRSLFDDLLVSPLNRTLTFIQIQNIAMFIAQNLEYRPAQFRRIRNKRESQNLLELLCGVGCR